MNDFPKELLCSITSELHDPTNENPARNRWVSNLRLTNHRLAATAKPFLYRRFVALGPNCGNRWKEFLRILNTDPYIAYIAN